MRPPELAVVVASEHGLRYLVGCLESLERNAPDAEVIVAAEMDDELRRELETRFPNVRLVSVDRPASIPELRAAGIFASTAPYVAVIEDPCRALEGWAGHLVAAHDQGHEVVGGPIRNSPQHRIRDWAAFFCEYSASMDPSPEGEVDELPGMNISYSRGAVAAMDDLLRAGHWESWLHPRLRDRGFRLWRASAARVDHAQEFGVHEFLLHCWRHSRAHAGARNAILGRRRIVYAVGAPLILIVLYLRIARNVLSRRSNVRELALATPLILLYNATWAAGEATGYVFGAGRGRLREP